MIAAGATPAHASTWSTLSGYQCSGGSLGGQQLSLAAAKRACVDNPRCSGVYDDGRGGFALCDSVRLCADKNTSGLVNSKTKKLYTCAQAKTYCAHATLGKIMTANCPKTCDVCTTSVPAGGCVRELVVRVSGDSCQP